MRVGEDLGISDAALAEEKEENSLREVAMVIGLLSQGIESRECV